MVMENKTELTCKHREWWFGLIIITLLVAALTIFASMVINGTLDDTIPPNDLTYELHQ
jgi:hypothetical protein